MDDNQQKQLSDKIEKLHNDIVKGTGFNKPQVEHIMNLTHLFYDKLFEQIDKTNKRLDLYSEVFAKETKEINRKIDALKKANNLK